MPKEKTRRNKTIMKLRNDGWTIRKIARKYDLSEARVQQIIEREKKR